MSSNYKSIEVKNISKYYKVFERPQDRFKQGLMRGRKTFYKEFWALKDVNFEVGKGETIGIVGSNGSGKSTILQIITKTLEPTNGEVVVNGRVSALLELGSGFNPEFTGRENVYLNGAILGFSKKQMDEKMKYIEEFAEIGDFINQPVKVYSSGMFVRLAFATAVNVDPDILIIDEALAVGDMQFQLKCMNKMKSFKKEGKTILFVSHDTYSVKNFCDQAIWMRNGSIHMRGEVNKVINEYEDFMRTADKVVLPEEEPINSDILSIDSVEFLDANGNKRREFEFSENFNVNVNYTLKEEFKGLVGGVAIIDKQNTYVCGLNTKLDNYELPSKPGKHSLVLNYENISLLPGTYFIDVGFFESSGIARLDYRSRVNSFLINSGKYMAEGITLIQHHWKC